MFRTLGAKLAAPFALFLLPIAFLLFFLVRTHEQGLASARNELSGLPSINVALGLANALLAWQGPAETARVHADAARVIGVLSRDAALWQAHPYTQGWLRSGITLAEQVLQRDRITPEETLEAVDLLANIVQAVGDASELILDPELSTYYLMDLLVNQQPQILAGLAALVQHEAASVASGVTHQQIRERSLGHHRAIDTLVQNFQRSHNALKRYTQGPQTGLAIDEPFSRYLGQLTHLQHQHAEDDVGHGGGAIEPALLEAALVARQSASGELERLLNERIRRIEGARDRQILAALSLFIVAACAMLGLILALIVRPVKQLTSTMLSLAQGDVSVMPQAVVRSDEIGAMSRAVLVFKDNAILKQALEERTRRDAAALELTATTLQRAERIAGMGNWRHDFTMQTTVMSPALYELLGFDPKQGQPRFSEVLARTEPTDRAGLRAALSEGANGRHPSEATIRYDHPLRGQRFLRLVIETERDRRGEPLTMVGAVHDVSAIKVNEINLEARSEALAEAQAMGRIGNWSWRLGDARVSWSPEVYRLVRLTPAPLGPNRSDVMARCKGDGARLLLDAEAEVMRTRGVKAVDVTMQRGDGSLADFTITSKAELNAEGAVIGVFGTIQDISERKNAERELEKLAYYDPLSGLANRALFQRAIRRAVSQSLASGQSGALLMLDLDRFKEVNDSLGHQAGDELLVKVAERLRRSLPQDAFLARLGGDEFAGILSACDQQSAAEIADRLIDALAEPIQLSMGEVSVGTSIGIAMMPGDGSTADELLGHADLALYRAKDSGRAQAQFFSPEFSEIAQDKIRLARELAQAVSADEGLYLVYQPQIDLRSGGVIGFEALVRWQHPTRGNIPPSEFVPIAESSKLICDLGLWVLRSACEQIRVWRDEGLPLREVAVNVSAAQFWHSDMERDIEAALVEAGIPPDLLCIEVTESVFVREGEGRVRKALDRLRHLGVRLALDDFGTGYSSLAYLNRFPFDKLKIDRSFVDGVDRDPDKHKLLQGIVSMSRALGKRTIAEGAEHDGEVEVLAALGCDIVQGFVFSRPLRAEDLMQKVSEIEALAFARAVPSPGAQALPARSQTPASVRSDLSAA